MKREEVLSALKSMDSDFVMETVEDYIFEKVNRELAKLQYSICACEDGLLISHGEADYEIDYEAIEYIEMKISSISKYGIVPDRVLKICGKGVKLAIRIYEWKEE